MSRKLDTNVISIRRAAPNGLPEEPDRPDEPTEPFPWGILVVFVAVALVVARIMGKK